MGHGSLNMLHFSTKMVVLESKQHGTNGTISKGIMSMCLYCEHIPTHQSSLTKKWHIKNRLFSSMVNVTISCAFSQNCMTGYPRKEVCVADWLTQSAPSTGSGNQQWPKTKQQAGQEDGSRLHRQSTSKGNAT